MAVKIADAIKEARTGAGLTQEQLARKVKGLSADDISKAERGVKTLTQAVLKDIAKVTGVTQKSLLDAAKGTDAKKTTGSSSAKKTAGSSSSKKTSGSSSSKKSSGSSSSSKKSSSSSSHSSSSFKPSSEEKKLILAYREADDKVKSTVKLLLSGAGSDSSSGSSSSQSSGVDLLSSLVSGLKTGKGSDSDLLGSLLGGSGSSGGDSDLLGSLLNGMKDIFQ